jgi:hypothetical protein
MVKLNNGWASGESGGFSTWQFSIRCTYQAFIYFCMKA